MDNKEEVKKLWKLCFDDEEGFTELYFRYRYKEDINMVVRREGHIVSALQMLPYPMTFAGSVIDTAYISGACTHPEYRGEGIMRELLSLSFASMSKNGIPVSTLIPAEAWLFDYYGRMGYAPAFEYETREINTPPASAATGIATSSSYIYKEEIYNYLSEQMMKRPCCIQHTEEDYKVILADLALSGGSVLTACRQSRVTGAAIVTPGKDAALIEELVADDSETEAHLLNEVFRLFRLPKIRITCPAAEQATPQPLGMIRIIDAKAILNLYAAAHPEQELMLELTDRELPANNGYYHIIYGKCLFSERKMAEPIRRVSAKELAMLLFYPLRPYMSLMLN